MTNDKPLTKMGNKLLWAEIGKGVAQTKNSQSIGLDL